MGYVDLTEGKVALVDDVDLEVLNRYKWSAVFRFERWYGYSFVNSKVCAMHRFVMGRVLGRQLVKSEMVDHINNNPLDNRRDNLRICDRTNNAMNRGKNKNNTTGFKGVMCRTSTKRGKMFYALHRQKGGKEYRKYFYTDRAAALFYDDVVRDLYEIVGLNFPNLTEVDRQDIIEKEKQEEIRWHESRGISKWSRYKGVHWHSDNRHWRAKIIKHGKAIFDRLFEDEEEAAQARDYAMIELGLVNISRSNLNFPER